jgi:hypothetical protein
MLGRQEEEQAHHRQELEQWEADIEERKRKHCGIADQQLSQEQLEAEYQAGLHSTISRTATRSVTSNRRTGKPTSRRQTS